MTNAEYEMLLKMREKTWQMMDTFCGDVVYCEDPKFSKGRQLCDPVKDDKSCPYRNVFRKLERLLVKQTVRIERAKAEAQELKGIYERLAERSMQSSRSA